LSRLTFTPVGGGREIGANAFLLSNGKLDVLLDCGLHPKKEGQASLPCLSLLTKAPEAVLISHGHVDHCGATPYLLKQFSSTTPYATCATLQIMDRMLHNSVSVMGAMALERGIKEYPLYAHTDVDYVMRRAYGIEFEREFAVTTDGSVRASFHPAGHVLGSAGILLRMAGHSLFYTGDICADDQELVNGLVLPNLRGNLDTLVIESTYGANGEADNATLHDEVDRFAAATRAVIERKGCALVPSFALGRTQEMLTIVARLQREKRLPEVPVYASGLGRAIYEVYAKNVGMLRPEADLRPLSEFGRIGDARDRKLLRDLVRKPAVVVATSGMMIENTPSALLAQEMVRQRRHGIFFVGYLDPDTLGYKLLHSAAGDALRFEYNGPLVTRKLDDIRQFNFSAHAPRKALCEVVARLDPKNVVFVHGDPEAVAWLHERYRYDRRAFAPCLGETVALES